MDPRVIDLPWLLRAVIVYGCILPWRPRRMARRYTKIWTPEGAPLIATSHKVQHALRKRLGVPVELAMRYQNPSIHEALVSLYANDVEDLLVIPLFPQHAMSSYTTAIARVKGVAAREVPLMQLRFAPPFFDDPGYIQALAESAAPALNTEHDHVLLSFHGLPERHVHTNPYYRTQCMTTARAFADVANIKKYSVSFQSRLGGGRWMEPYTEAELTRLARDGVKKLLVICPGFVTDCLETLEEIAIHGRKTFLAAGGEEYSVAPCLNDHPRWLDALENFVRNPRGDSG